MHNVPGRHRHGIRATGVWFSHSVAQLPAPVSHQVCPIRRRIYHAQRRPVFGLLQVSIFMAYIVRKMHL